LPKEAAPAKSLSPLDFLLVSGCASASSEGEETAFFAKRISLSALFATPTSQFCDFAASLFSRAWASFWRNSRKTSAVSAAPAKV
jgi:hypothetical protein